MTARKTTFKLAPKPAPKPAAPKTKAAAPKQQFFYFDSYTSPNFNASKLKDTEGHLRGPFATLAALQADVDNNFDGDAAEIEVLTIHKRFKIETKTTFTEI